MLEHGAALDPDSAHVVYHLGLVAERLDDSEAAATAFARANALDPSHFPMPVEVSDDVFGGSVKEALDNLPRSIREYIEGVPVLVEDFPTVDLVELENVSPQILGIFMGVPRTEAVLTSQVPDLDRVVIFKKNLEKVCQDREEVIDQIQVTVRHEIGHYLGLDEDDLERLGLA